MRKLVLGVLLGAVLLLPTILSMSIKSPQVSPARLIFPNETMETGVYPGDVLRTHIDAGNRNEWAASIRPTVSGNISNWVNVTPKFYKLEPSNEAGSNYWSDRFRITITIPRECEKGMNDYGFWVYSEKDWAERERVISRFASEWLPYTPCVYRGKWYGNETWYTEGPYAGSGKWGADISIITESVTSTGQGINVGTAIPFSVYVEDYTLREKLTTPMWWYLSPLHLLLLVAVLALGVFLYYYFTREPFEEEA